MSALEKFAGWGLHFNKPSDEQVVLPPDITDISSEQLGEIFTRLTSWTDYIASQMVMAQLADELWIRVCIVTGKQIGRAHV